MESILEELMEANSAMVDKNLELIKKDMDNKDIFDQLNIHLQVCLNLDRVHN